MAWQWEIKPETSWLEFNWKELWSYRHLLTRLIRRDFLTQYQQTLLGPAWVVIQPLITVLMYVIIFDRVVGISTNNAPPFLFYLAGIIVWNLFAETFMGAVFTFSANATLFSKVYFPRLVIPFSITAAHIIRFFIQFILFLIFYGYNVFKGNVIFAPLHCVLSLLFTVTITAMLGLGLGLSLSVFIAKYRDLGNLIQLCIRLLLFATPIIYPFSIVPENIQEIMVFNPLVPIIEFFRYSFLGHGIFSIPQLLYSMGWALFAFLGGSILFNKMGAKLIDVV